MQAELHLELSIRSIHGFAGYARILARVRASGWVERLVGLLS